MHYFIVTYGCQMNKSDSERLAFFLESNNIHPSPTLEKADLILINTCSVRQTAVDRVYGKILTIKKDKKKKIYLTGCILEKDRKKLEKQVDLIFNIKDFSLLSRFIKKPKNIPDYFKIRPNFSNFIPIMTGCNNFCTYCVVPYTRGREFSRKPKEILEEINLLLKNNIKLIWLLGQNVNSYEYNFNNLLKEIKKIKKKFWLQFTSSHPKDFSLELIKTMKNCNIKYLNLPVQSGDDDILKKMNRPYTIKQYKKIIKEIRKQIPDISLSTDIIVGFPGETKKQFENTKKLFKEIKYDMAYINKYSPREGTKASLLKDNVSAQEKKRREKELTKILAKTALDNNKKYLGKVIEVIVIKENLGITKSNKKVKILSKELGKFKKVKITQVFSWGLKA
jgi:tRNA-2-methylthio-N6-dimethylallyladenosine synthase